MYTPDAHANCFTHSLRLDTLPNRFQELIRDWSRHVPSEARLQYCDGEFFMVVPFEMLEADTISLMDLSVFIRRFNRLHEVGNHSALLEHMTTYPCKEWTRHGEELDHYIEMMCMLHHLKANLEPALSKPATLAVFVHD